MSLQKRSSSCPLYHNKKIVYANGNYEGDVRDGKPHGFGTLNTNGEIYDGLFLSGKFVRGKKIVGNNIWKGEWNDRCFKQGQQINNDGTTITGEWIDGQLNGKVTKEFTNGNKLYCNYKYGICLGFAKLEYVNGNALCGIIIDDKFYGYGEFLEKKCNGFTVNTVCYESNKLKILNNKKEVSGVYKINDKW